LHNRVDKWSEEVLQAQEHSLPKIVSLGYLREILK